MCGVCMYVVCMCVCVCVCVCACMCPRTSIRCGCVRTYVRACVYVYDIVCDCVFEWVCVCLSAFFVCIALCMCVCVYVCVRFVACVEVWCKAADSKVGVAYVSGCMILCERVGMLFVSYACVCEFVVVVVEGVCACVSV